MKKNTNTPSTSRLRLGYPDKLIETTLLEVKFDGRKLALQPCHNISTISAKSKHFLMKLQRCAPRFIQKRAFAQRYTRESQAMKKA